MSNCKINIGYIENGSKMETSCFDMHSSLSHILELFHLKGIAYAIHETKWVIAQIVILYTCQYLLFCRKGSSGSKLHFILLEATRFIL